MLSGHCLLALVQATAPLAYCVTSMAAASTIFTRCSAAFRRPGTWSLRRSSSQVAVSRFEIACRRQGVLYNERDLFTSPKIQDMLQFARKSLVSRGACTKSRLLSRPKKRNDPRRSYATRSYVLIGMCDPALQGHSVYTDPGPLQATRLS